MKNLLISVVALVFVASMASAQRGDLSRYNNYTPVTLDGVSAMTALSVALALDDTTKDVDTRGFSFCGVNIVGSSDSIGVLVAVQGSKDGITYSAFTTLDSVISRTSGVTGIGAVPVPDKWMSFPYLRFRITGSAGGNFGATPTPTVAVEVVRRY